MTIPANVRSSWRGVWGEPSYKKVPPKFLPRLHLAAQSKAVIKGTAYAPNLLGIADDAHIDACLFKFPAEGILGRDPIASTTESAGIVTSFPLESV